MKKLILSAIAIIGFVGSTGMADPVCIDDEGRRLITSSCEEVGAEQCYTRTSGYGVCLFFWCFDSEEVYCPHAAE